MSGEVAGRSPGAPRRELVAVFAVAALVYLASPVRRLSDSTYTLLVSHQIWKHGTLDLREPVGREPMLDRFPGARRGSFPYQLRAVGEGAEATPPRARDPWRLYYDFPVGGAMLAVPMAAAADLLGAPVVDPSRGGYLVRRDHRYQGWTAALFAAAFVAAAHAALRLALERRIALAATAVLALASPVWSTASRGLWSHTGCLLLAGFALPSIVRLARGESVRGVIAGACLAGAYVARPTAAVFLGVVGVWIAFRHRRALAGFLIGAAPILAAYVALNLATWGEPLPPYYDGSRVAQAPELAKLTGQWLSPSRGLLVYSPWIVPLLVLGAARWRRMELRELHGVGVVGVMALAAVTATFGHWWGGYAYGPRLLTESMFFLVLCAVAALPTLEAGGDRGWRRAFAAAALLGAIVHAGGVLSRQGMLWNSLPRSVDEAPERIWDWRDPQWLAWANRGPREPPKGEPDERP